MTQHQLPEVPGYRLHEPIGRGTSGTVWRGEAQGFPGRVVAIKLVDGPALGAAQRLRREADALARLSHPNVLRVLEVVDTADRVALVTPLATGGSLAHRVAAGAVVDDPVALADLAARLSSGLAAAHTAGLVHRDVKPANILFDREDQPLLADLGTAGLRGAPGDVVGTVEYLDPALLDGQAPDVASDLYGLGVTLYEAAVGIPPYAGATPERTLAAATRGVHVPIGEHVGLPEPLAALIEVLFARDPAVRPTSATEVAARFDELERLLRRDAGPDIPPPPGGRAGVLGAVPRSPDAPASRHRDDPSGTAPRTQPGRAPADRAQEGAGTSSEEARSGVTASSAGPSLRPPAAPGAGTRVGDQGRSGTVRWGPAPDPVGDEADPEPTDDPRRPPRWLLVGGAVAAVAVPLVVVGWALAGAPDRADRAPDPAAALDGTEPRSPAPVCDEDEAVDLEDTDGAPLLADVDGRGCSVAVGWDGRTLQIPGPGRDPVRFELGADPDDVLLFGDWNCDGRDAPALYRPADGRVFTFDAIDDAATTTTVTGEPSGVVDGRPEVRTDATGCDVLLVRPAP